MLIINKYPNFVRASKFKFMLSDMDPESLHIKTWKEVFEGFERANSYVIFSHGTVVIFDETHKDKGQ